VPISDNGNVTPVTDARSRVGGHFSSDAFEFPDWHCFHTFGAGCLLSGLKPTVFWSVRKVGN
jgi:hypothetical protein